MKTPPDIPKMPLEELYQEVILDHNRNPRNYKIIEPCDCQSHAYNPLCGDDVTVYLKMQGRKIEDVGFQGKGCAISKSSASMMTAKIKHKSVDEILALKNQFVLLVTGEVVPDERDELLGNLKIFEGVKQFPLRVKCATMVWHALADALKQEKS